MQDEIVYALLDTSRVSVPLPSDLVLCAGLGSRTWASHHRLPALLTIVGIRYGVASFRWREPHFLPGSCDSH